MAPATFDLVSGVACLHELDDPDLVLAAAARALRPGGYAVFLAPFDGHGVLRLAYERIRAEAPLWPDAPLAPGVDAALESLNRRHRRADPCRTPPIPASRPWTRSGCSRGESLETAARAAFGFREVRFLAHNDHETLYRDVAAMQVQMVTGHAEAALPDWALALLDSFVPGRCARR